VKEGDREEIKRNSHIIRKAYKFVVLLVLLLKNLNLRNCKS